MLVTSFNDDPVGGVAVNAVLNTRVPFVTVTASKKTSYILSLLSTFNNGQKMDNYEIQNQLWKILTGT